MLASVRPEVEDIDVRDTAPNFAGNDLQMAAACESNVNLLSITTPSDLIFDDTGRLAPATVTVSTHDAALSCAEVPTNMTSGLSALSRRSLSANRQRTLLQNNIVVSCGD